MSLNFTTDVRPASDSARLPSLGVGAMLAQLAVLVAGPHTVATLRAAQLHDKFVLYVPSTGTDSATRHQVIRELIAQNFAVVVMSDEDSATFVQRAHVARQRPYWLVNDYLRTTVTQGWGLIVRADALRDLLRLLGIELAMTRTLAQPVLRLLPLNTWCNLAPTIDTTTVKPIVAPNVVGILQGTDARAGYLILSAHLDTDGRRGGANDNALGVAGLLALAKALSQPGVRPRPSVVFLATSGSAGSGRDFWGARYFVHESPWANIPPMLNLTLDLLGQGPRDSVWVAGLHDLELSVRPEWLAGAHPELGLTVVDAGTVLTAESDHFAFLERGVPSLYVSNGTHVDSLPGPDTPAQLDTAQAVRALKLVFYITEAAANTDRSPSWTSEARQRRIELFGR